MSLEIAQDTLHIIAYTYSIVAIAFTVPIVFVFRQYFRLLDYVQLVYLFSVAFPADDIFSKYLSLGFGQFSSNLSLLSSLCTSGSFICVTGFQLSYCACVAGSILLLGFIVMLVKCKKSGVGFEPVYRFMKGLIRWGYFPLSYYSTLYLIYSLQGEADDLIPSVVVLAVCVLFPILQLIGYKCIQTAEDKIWRKWLQFFSYLRLLIIAVLIAAYQVTTLTGYVYGVLGPFVLYLIIVAWKHSFVNPALGRVLFILGECCVISLFCLFVWGRTFIVEYQLDLFLLSAVIFFDLIYYIAKTAFYCKHGIPDQVDHEKINPQDSDYDRGNKKKNRYKVQLEDFGNQFTTNTKRNRDSYEDLNQLSSGNIRSSKIVSKGNRKRR